MEFSSMLRKNLDTTFLFFVVLIAIAFSGYLDSYFAFVATSWIIFGLLGMSLDIVWGKSGFLCLGQTAFYGLSGYLSSIITMNIVADGSNSLFIALPAGALIGALSAIILGALIFYTKMGQLQSTILSYTFTLLLWSVSQSFTAEIGAASVSGDSGLANIPGMAAFFINDNQPLWPNDALRVVIFIAFVIYVLTKIVMATPFGKVIDCIRIDEDKTELIGYDIRKYKMINFCYAGAIAGLAGALFAMWSNFVNPSIFSIQEALLVPIYVLVGGLGTLIGPFIGAILIGALSFFLGNGSVGSQTTLILGVILIVMVMFLKDGLLGTLKLFIQRYLPDSNQSDLNTKPVKINEPQLIEILNKAKEQVGDALELQTHALRKSFGGITPVNDVTRHFRPGVPYSLIGPNGAGKSSFLKTCVGINIPDRGKVIVDGRDITNEKIFRRVNLGLGVKNQKPQVFGELTVFDNLWISAYSRLRDKQAATAISYQIITMLGLAPQVSALASSLSHGQQQWLDIGMILSLSPRILFLDEPAAGMTNDETRELSRLIRILSSYMTVVIVEHDMEFIRTLEGHVTVLHQGEVFAEGDIQKLREDERVLDIYLGRSAHV